MNKETIAAIATASGRGAVGIVRCAGPACAVIARGVLGRLPSPREATYLAFLDADGGVIDRGLAIWFPAPHSYTGDDVIEFQAHGGPVVLRRLLNRCLGLASAETGLTVRLAEPGEFTQRAFLNGKLDLAQAEAVADLIDAATEAAARGAAASLSGVFSRRVGLLVDALTTLRVLVEGTLDFPEEEIDFVERFQVVEKLRQIRENLAEVFDAARVGQRLRDGMTVVLAGAPNVGKSSLLNALAGRDLAIVTAIAGTTRDRVEAQIDIDGMPLNVIDTAGLRFTVDPVEQMGIERTREALRTADAVIWLRDGADPMFEAEVLAEFPPSIPRLTVWNKVDLVHGSAHVSASHDELWISAKTGAGIDVLKRELCALVGFHAPGLEGQILARERHLAALRLADHHLGRAWDFTHEQVYLLELLAEELRLAQQALSSITGAFTADDLLGEIFSRFCIGK